MNSILNCNVVVETFVFGSELRWDCWVWAGWVCWYSKILPQNLISAGLPQKHGNCHLHAYSQSLSNDRMRGLFIPAQVYSIKWAVAMCKLEVVW